jgi:hypothetical protein
MDASNSREASKSDISNCSDSRNSINDYINRDSSNIRYTDNSRDSSDIRDASYDGIPATAAMPSRAGLSATAETSISRDT